MSTLTNKNVVRRFLEGHAGQEALDRIDELFAPNYLNHGAGHEPMDLASVKREAANFYTVFPDLTVTVEDLIAEGDRVAARVTITGTHSGAFEGRPGTGRRIHIAGMEFFRLEDGKIAEDWPLVDFSNLLRQLDACG